MKTVKKIRNQNHDSTYFNSLYGEYSSVVFRFIYRLIGDKEEAEDIVQETFVKLHNHTNSKNHIREPRAWIFRVAVNIGYNYLKRKKRFQEYLNQYPEKLSNHFSLISKDCMVDQEIKKQEVTIVRNAINKLLPRDRIILELYQNDFSYAQIARMVRVRKSSLRTILYRAIDKLEKEIKKGEGR